LHDRPAPPQHSAQVPCTMLNVVDMCVRHCEKSIQPSSRTRRQLAQFRCICLYSTACPSAFDTTSQGPADCRTQPQACCLVARLFCVVAGALAAVPAGLATYIAGRWRQSSMVLPWCRTPAVLWNMQSSQVLCLAGNSPRCGLHGCPAMSSNTSCRHVIANVELQVQKCLLTSLLP
jgi:hypothetical protein